MSSVSIFDSTLRDGAQGEGISFSVEDKLSIIKALDSVGIQYIEAGNPFSNEKEIMLFERASKLKLKNAQLVAFGSTRRKGHSVNDDKNLQKLLDVGTKCVSIFGKCSLLHVNKVLNTTAEENCAMIYDSCQFLKEHKKTVFFDAEHFFDGYKENKAFALKTIQAANDGGADYIILCDTNGAAFPAEIYEIVKEVSALFPGKVGIHTHNDRGMAVACSVMAVSAGAVQVQGTFLGYGERCGNAALSTVIPNLQLCMGINCINKKYMPHLTETARKLAEISNINLRRNEPYVGTSAFSHKAGMHADGVLKLHSSYEHIDPSLVGNERKVLMSEFSGRTAVLERIKKINPHLTKDSPETAVILNELKRKEALGYQFEGADSSFEMLIRRCLGAYKSFFELSTYKIISAQPSEENCSATATVKVRVGEKEQLMAAEGNGPINALDKALRFALEVFYPSLKKMHLIDYKVRVLDSSCATASAVRVLITSTDGAAIWSTIGVSADVVEASRLALAESIEYKLIKDRL